MSKNSIKHKSFICTQFKCQTVLYNPLIGPYQELSLWARVDRGAMAMKEYSALPKAPVLLATRGFRVISRTPMMVWGCLTTLQRCSQCILQLQSNGLRVYKLGWRMKEREREGKLISNLLLVILFLFMFIRFFFLIYFYVLFYCNV